MVNYHFLKRVFKYSALLAGAAISLSSCNSTSDKPSIEFEAVAFSGEQWTGLAVSKEGRLFVNYPSWKDGLSMSVGEVVNGQAHYYPDAMQNSWWRSFYDKSAFICVQAVFIDSLDRLWVLDPANPQFKGRVEDGAKLMQYDLKSGKLIKTFKFSDDIALEDSYLNDVRIDVKRNFAYITDSGNSGLVIVNLETGEARRVLDNHYSTAAEDIELMINGVKWSNKVHSDGIAYDAIRDMLYYQALTSRTMYRIPGWIVRNPSLTDHEIAQQVGKVGRTGASDGLICGPDGRIYISSLEKNAILRTTPEGRIETVVSGPEISWPDSFSFGPDGKLYFTTSRIHEGAKPKEKYGIYRIDLE